MNLTKKQENTLEEIKSFESEPKIVQLFDNKKKYQNYWIFTILCQLQHIT